MPGGATSGRQCRADDLSVLSIDSHKHQPRRQNMVQDLLTMCPEPCEARHDDCCYAFIAQSQPTP